MTHLNEEDEMRMGRREYDELQVVDTTNVLTKEELQELKRLASLSKTARFFVLGLMAIVSLVGLPAIISLIQKHFTW